ncbi:YkgJ family cysteine cluster protein [Jonquetella anthropi]|uniref:YkgJ family cysteine cluster protein n=1 Tax=Jonquetella anthropi TaxID=428712 RepID=UPI003C6D2ECB
MPETVKQMARALNLTEEAFARTYMTSRWRYPSLASDRSGRCVLLTPSDRCALYELRPVHCRTWPFWPQVLESSQAWQEAAKRCPGMNDGPLIGRQTIMTLLDESVRFFMALSEWNLLKKQKGGLLWKP